MAMRSAKIGDRPITGPVGRRKALLTCDGSSMDLKPVTSFLELAGVTVGYSINPYGH